MQKRKPNFEFNPNIHKELESLLATDVFKTLVHSEFVQIGQICAAVTLLIKSRIPFDLEYSPGTRRLAESAELTIYINPTTTLVFVISLESGGGLFGGTT